MDSENKTRKVAIVTGASSGIGKAIVTAFLDAGYSVYGGARRVEMMSDIEKKGAKIQSLDLTLQTSIEKFISSILDTEDRIDVLVNNAGYGSYGAVEDVPMEEARRQFEVNLFGLAAMTNSVLPTMRMQRHGKIVHIGSIGGKLWSILGGWYQASKFALEGLADCTRNELRPFGIDVILIEPGAIKSEWNEIAVKNLKSMSENGPYQAIANSAVTTYEDAKDMEVEPNLVANVIISAVTTARPNARYVVPTVGKIMLFLRWLLSDRMFDALWCRFMKVPKIIE